MSANDNIRSRVTEILEKAAEKTGVTIERVITEMAKIGFADIRKAVDWYGHLVTEEDNPDGGDTLVVKHIHTSHVRLISAKDIDDDTAAAIAEVRQSPTGGLSLKMHDKHAALVSLYRHLRPDTGKNGEQAPINLNFQFIDAPPRETYEQWMARRGRELSAGTGTTGKVIPMVAPARSSD